MSPHRIDIEAEWDDFTRMKAMVDEEDADTFLAVMYGWRDECVTDALRSVRADGRKMGDRCHDCGPGYWIGDDGCRHGPAASLAPATPDQP